MGGPAAHFFICPVAISGPEGWTGTLDRINWSPWHAMSELPQGALAQVEALVTPAVEAMGYRIVRVRFGGGDRPVLEIMAERTDGVGMTVEDCAEISRAVSAILDVDDPIAGSYTLEVSSPGIDRPLVRLDDFVRYAGYEAKVELEAPLDGQRRFRGRLLGAGDDVVRIEVDGDEVALPYASISKAKLVLTDELLKQAEQQQQQQ